MRKRCSLNNFQGYKKIVGNYSFVDGRHWFDVLVDICNNTGEDATEFLQCFNKNLTLSSKKIIHGVDYLGKFTFEAAYPTWRTVFSPHYGQCITPPT